MHLRRLYEISFNCVDEIFFHGRFILEFSLCDFSSMCKESVTLALQISLIFIFAALCRFMLAFLVAVASSPTLLAFMSWSATLATLLFFCFFGCFFWLLSLFPNTFLSELSLTPIALFFRGLFYLYPIFL